MKAIIILAVLGIVLMYLGLLKNTKPLIPVAIIGLLVALGVNISEWNSFARLFNDMAYVDNFSVLFNSLLIGLTIIIFLLVNQYFKGVINHIAEIYALLIFALAGALMMTSFSSIIMLFIGIETMSMPLYILAGSKKFSIKSNEASFKYFLLGSFASAIFLLGVTLIYGASGSFSVEGIAEYIQKNYTQLPGMVYGGVILILIALSFKVAASPFHFWAPDVYDGSPTMITLFMATIVKTASIAAFFRLFSGSFAMLGEKWNLILWIIIALTFIVGNFGALLQSETKRLFAYSSISHTGFLLFPILAISASSAAGLLYYSLAYSLATIVVFGIFSLVKNQAKGNSNVDAFNGLAKQNPVLAVCMTIALLSFAGIPITAGFFAKYFVFVQAILSGYFWIVIIGILAALVGVFYYFRFIIAMFFKSGDESKITLDLPYKISLAIATIGILVLGILPNLITDLF